MSTIHFWKKNGTFLFHSICHEIQFTDISLNEDTSYKQKIFFFISASRSKSENYLPYLNMKKKLPPLFITCSLLLNYSKVSVWYIHNKDIGRMYSFCHIIYPKYVFDTIIQCCPNEYTTLEACIARTLWTKIRYTSFSLGDISDKRTINNSNDFNKFWFVPWVYYLYI